MLPGVNTLVFGDAGYRDLTSSVNSHESGAIYIYIIAVTQSRHEGFMLFLQLCTLLLIIFSILCGPLLWIVSFQNLHCSLCSVVEKTFPLLLLW